MSKTNENRLYFTPEEVCEQLPLGRSVVYRELRRGTIPSIRIGKRFVIPKSAFHRWLETAALKGVEHAA